MRPSLYHVYPVLALLALAGASVWLERITREDDARPASAERRDPDFTAEHTRLISYGSDGRVRYELLANQVVNYPFPGVTELDRPRLRYDTDGRVLHVAAQKGEVSQGGDEVFLKGDVSVVRAPAQDSPEMTFSSQSLRVWPDDERAETHDPVVLTQGANKATALGLRTDHLFGTIDLLGDVHIHMPRSTRTSR